MNPQGFWMQRCEIENWASEKLVSISKHLRACCSAIKTQHTHHLFCGLSRPLSVTATIDEGIGSKKSSSLLVQSLTHSTRNLLFIAKLRQRSLSGGMRIPLLYSTMLLHCLHLLNLYYKSSWAMYPEVLQNLLSQRERVQ